MNKIYCIMGKSASGKDTIYRRLLQNTDLRLKKIIPYTTRPIRAKEQDGVQYYFTNEEKMQELKASGKVIECRGYNTIHGMWYYFTVDDHQVDLLKSSYLIIGTPEAYVNIRDYYGRDLVVPIYIELDDGIRLSRALGRERKQDNPKYEEMCRRFLADKEDFSPEKIAQAGITRTFVNNRWQDCLEEILAYIEVEG